MLHHRPSQQRAGSRRAPGAPLIDVRQAVKTYSSASGALLVVSNLVETVRKASAASR